MGGHVAPKKSNSESGKTGADINLAEVASTKDLIVVFMIAIFIPVTAYVVFTMPQLFEDIAIHQFQISTVQFEGLYSIYSVPNFIMVPFGTLMLSYTGLGLGVVIFAGLIYIGVLIMYLGFYTNNWWLVFFGRGFHGLGSENITICAPTIFGMWFMGKALSVSLAVNRSFTQTMVSLSILLVPRIFQKFRRMDEVFLMYLLTAFLSFLSAAVYAVYEHFYQLKMDRDALRAVEGAGEGSRVSRLSSGKKTIGHETETYTEFMETQKENITLKTEKMASNLNTYARSGLSQKTTKTRISELTEADKKFVAKDITHFSPLFWFLSLVFMVGTEGAIMFDTFGTDFMMNRFGYTYDEGTLLYSTTVISTIICIPLFSFLTQVVGKKGIFLVLAHIIGAVSFFGFIFLPPRPNHLIHFILLLGVGVYNSLLLAVIWPCLTLSVPTRGTAVALDMATTVQNSLTFSLPIYFGEVNKKRNLAAYNTSMISLGALVTLSAVISTVATVYDFKHGGLLHLPENSPKIAKQRKAMENNYLRYKLNSLRKDGEEGGKSDYNTMADLQSRANKTELTEDFLKSKSGLNEQVGEIPSESDLGRQGTGTGADDFGDKGFGEDEGLVAGGDTKGKSEL